MASVASGNIAAGGVYLYVSMWLVVVRVLYNVLPAVLDYPGMP